MQRRLYFCSVPSILVTLLLLLHYGVRMFVNILNGNEIFCQNYFKVQLEQILNKIKKNFQLVKCRLGKSSCKINRPISGELFLRLILSKEKKTREKLLFFLKTLLDRATNIHFLS